MSRRDLPVPESPVRHKGWPLATQPQAARVQTIAGSMPGLAAKSKSRSALGRGKHRGLDPPLGPAAGAVVAFGEHQADEKAQVAHLLAGRGRSQLGEPGAIMGKCSTRQAESIATSAACSVTPRWRGMVTASLHWPAGPGQVGAAVASAPAVLTSTHSVPSARRPPADSSRPSQSI